VTSPDDALIADIDLALSYADRNAVLTALRRARDRITEDTGTMQTQNLRLAGYEQRLAALARELWQARAVLNDLRGWQIAAMYVAGIPKNKPLPERLDFAMRYVRKHEAEVFWMTGRPNDDLKFRTAIAAVMLAGSDEDKNTITRSMAPLKALSAMMAGVPVNMEAALAGTEDCIPLIKLWHDSGKD
jgi:hypothetical protein